MPVPTMAPTPRATRWYQLSVFFRAWAGSPPAVSIALRRVQKLIPSSRLFRGDDGLATRRRQGGEFAPPTTFRARSSPCGGGDRIAIGGGSCTRVDFGSGRRPITPPSVGP